MCSTKKISVIRKYIPTYIQIYTYVHTNIYVYYYKILIIMEVFFRFIKIIIKTASSNEIIKQKILIMFVNLSNYPSGCSIVLFITFK